MNKESLDHDSMQLTAVQKPSTDEKAAVTRAPRIRPRVNYELAMWVVYGAICTLAVLDRFFWNVWPRETMRIGRGTAGSDFKKGLKPGPWSVKVYDILARASGRFDIVALNLLMFTMMHATMAWFSETWLARKVVDFSDYVEANRRLHKWNGIGIVVMTLLHVWTIVLPCITDGWKAKVVLGYFEWPLSERGPKGFKDANVLTETMSLQGDDVFRIIEMTILLAVLLPLSIRWFSTRWHIGIHLHNFINVLYFIDIVRRHTHPHSWILNTPFFIAWIADICVGYYWRRRRPEIKRIHLSTDYMLLFWRQERKSNTVGPKYYLRMKDSSKLERAHVFSGFENRCDLNIAEGMDWSACLLLRVYRSKRNVRIMRQDKVSHTQLIADCSELDMYTWGPFHGGMSENIRFSLNESRHITLIGGGSAAGFLIDALQHFNPMTSPKMSLLYTTRDEALFDWYVKVMRQIMDNRGLKKCENIRIIVALTDGACERSTRLQDFVDATQESIDTESDSQSSDSGEGEGCKFSLQYGRLAFLKQLEWGNVVYFQGSGGLQKAVERGAKGKSIKLVAGPAYDNDEKKKKFFLGALREKLHRKDGYAA